MTPKHTPGPWHRNIPPATKYNTVWAGRNTHVAHVVRDGLKPEEVEGNIRLIAKAPDMRAKLEAVAARIESWEGFIDRDAVEIRALLAEIDGKDGTP